MPANKSPDSAGHSPPGSAAPGSRASLHGAPCGEAEDTGIPGRSQQAGSRSCPWTSPLLAPTCPSGPSSFVKHRARLQLPPGDLGPRGAPSPSTCVGHTCSSPPSMHVSQAHPPAPEGTPGQALTEGVPQPLPVLLPAPRRSAAGPEELTGPGPPLTVYSLRRSLARRGKESSRPGNRRAAGISTELDPRRVPRTLA